MEPDQMSLVLSKWAGWTYHGDDKDWPGYYPWRTPTGSWSDRIPDYAGSVDAIRSLLLRIADNRELRVKFVNHLRSVVGRRMPKNKMGAALVTDFDLVLAGPDEQCEALCKALGLWET